MTALVRLCTVIGAIALSVSVLLTLFVIWGLLVYPWLADRRARRRAIEAVIDASRSVQSAKTT